MHDLTPITALGGTEAQVDSHGSVTCTEMPGVALASVAARLGQEEAAQAALASFIGADLPGIARMTEGGIGLFWTGPEQWMAEAPLETHEDLAAQVKEAVGGAASVTEQTDAWTRFDLEGAGVVGVLELLSSLNTRSMATGGASRTAIHHLGCFVIRRGEERFTLYGPRASAGSLHHAIVAAMKAVM